MIIQSKNVFYEESFQPKQIVIKENKIIDILPYANLKDVRDYGKAIITPGLIDIHNHGYNSNDSNYTTKEWLKEWMQYLPYEGVTSTLPTLSSAPLKNIKHSLEIIKEFKNNESSFEGTNILGVNLEGPFISSNKPGAQSLKNKQIPTKKLIDELMLLSGNLIKYIMIAPEEISYNLDIISYCNSLGISVSIGHSGADFETIRKAVECGANSFTHTFNAMSQLTNREPGAVGAAMFFEHCYAELIPDSIHVHPVSANILSKIKDKYHLIFVTDSVAIKGLNIGKYNFKEREIIVNGDGVGRLNDGTIAGSANKMNKILYNSIYNINIDLTKSINSCTTNPCNLLNIKNKGLIKIGYDADISIFNSKFDVLDVFIGGKIFPLYN